MARLPAMQAEKCQRIKILGPRPFYLNFAWRTSCGRLDFGHNVIYNWRTFLSDFNLAVWSGVFIWVEPPPHLYFDRQQGLRTTEFFKSKFLKNVSTLTMSSVRARWMLWLLTSWLVTKLEIFQYCSAHCLLSYSIFTHLLLCSWPTCWGHNDG